MSENNFSRPKVFVSRCLGFDKCRFNAEVIKDHFVDKLSKFADIVNTCPEEDIWLWTPRFPVRLVNENKETRLYQNSTGKDFTESMNNFSENYLSNLEVDGFVMKYKSPSCGISNVKIYSKKDSNISWWKWKWLFSEKVFEMFPNYPIEDEARLLNFKIRENFLTKIFLLAKFRELKKEKSIKSLMDFQANNKYLFMSYNKQWLNKLWNIIANYNKKNLDETFENYHVALLELVSKTPLKTNTIDAFMHMKWYFSKTTTSEEKQFFDETINLFKEGRIPFFSIIHIIKSRALRDQNDYILNQTILNPFPKDLLELSDSWKPINI